MYAEIEGHCENQFAWSQLLIDVSIRFAQCLDLDQSYAATCEMHISVGSTARIPRGRKNKNISIHRLIWWVRLTERDGTDLKGKTAYFNVSLIARRIMQIVLINSRRYWRKLSSGNIPSTKKMLSCPHSCREVSTEKCFIRKERAIMSLSTPLPVWLCAENLTPFLSKLITSLEDTIRYLWQSLTERKNDSIIDIYET